MTEDYVSFETAKLLKEKGFDENTSVNYFVGDDKPRGCVVGEMIYHKRYEGDMHLIACPTIQMAMKWLREVHNIIPVILTGGDTVTPFYYWFRIDKINDGKWEDSVYRNETECNTYEEACEAAIKYCLKNLI